MYTQPALCPLMCTYLCKIIRTWDYRRDISHDANNTIKIGCNLVPRNNLLLKQQITLNSAQCYGVINSFMMTRGRRILKLYLVVPVFNLQGTIKNTFIQPVNLIEDLKAIVKSWMLTGSISNYGLEDIIPLSKIGQIFSNCSTLSNFRKNVVILKALCNTDYK